MAVLSLHHSLPNGGSFDFAYYERHHLALVDSVWGQFLDHIEVLRGVGTLDPNAPLPYSAITLLYFRSDADLQAALQHPDAALLQQDIGNFSPVAPAVQINTVLCR